MEEQKQNLVKKLVDKSIEAFIMGLEIYNKPTIKYRVEGFSFFICNAWELMLKAELLKRDISIYFKDNPERTISLTETVRLIYPDKNTRVRQNLEKIIDLRNISTHFVTEDYELIYVPLFQACALNFTNVLQKFHGKDITNYVSQNFLTISASIEPLILEDIKVKYPPEIAEKLILHANEIQVLANEYNSDKFAVDIEQNLYITRKSEEADFSVSINKESDNKVEIVKERKDPSTTHKYSFSSIIDVINERLNKKSIKLGYRGGFNTYVLSSIISFYNIKADERYAYCHKIGKSEQYTYSEEFINFIIKEINKDPENYVNWIREGLDGK